MNYKFTAKQTTWILLTACGIFAFLKPCPGEYCNLGDVEPKFKAGITIIFWLLFTGFYIKRRFFGDDFWAIRIGESILFLVGSYVISVLIQYSVIRIYCIVASTKEYQIAGFVTKAKQAGKHRADSYFMTLHTVEGDHDFFTSRKATVGDSITLQLHRTSWGVVYGSKAKQ